MCWHCRTASSPLVCCLGRHFSKQPSPATESSSGVREQGRDAHSISALNANARLEPFLHFSSGEHAVSKGAAGNSAAQHLYGRVGSWLWWHAGPRNFLWPQSADQDLVQTSVSCQKVFISDPLSVRTVPQPERSRNVFNFWPGGGGELEEAVPSRDGAGKPWHAPTLFLRCVLACYTRLRIYFQEQQPLRGYFIAGTWTKWRAIKMESEGWACLFTGCSFEHPFHIR